MPVRPRNLGENSESNQGEYKTETIINSISFSRFVHLLRCARETKNLGENSESTNQGEYKTETIINSISFSSFVYLLLCARETKKLGREF